MGKHAKPDLFSKTYEFLLKDRNSFEILSLYFVLIMTVNLLFDYLNSSIHSLVHQMLLVIIPYPAAIDISTYQSIIAHDFGQPVLQTRFLELRKLFDFNLNGAMKEYESLIGLEDYASNGKYISQILLILCAIFDIFKTQKNYQWLLPWFRLCIISGIITFLGYLFYTAMNSPINKGIITH